MRRLCVCTPARVLLLLLLPLLLLMLCLPLAGCGGQQCILPSCRWTGLPCCLASTDAPSQTDSQCALPLSNCRDGGGDG